MTHIPCMPILMFRKFATLLVLSLFLSGALFQTLIVHAQSSQGNPGWVPDLNRYVYYLEMPVAQDKAGIAQVESTIKQKAGVLSCASKGNPVKYFVLHTSMPVDEATMQAWAISAGTTLTQVYAHGTRAYQAWQTRPGNTRIPRKAIH